MGEDSEIVELYKASAKEDLADRYQNMLDSQLSAIENFDTKAWRVARLVGIVLGVLFTALSVFSDEAAIELSLKFLPVILAVSIGILALVASLVFSSLCILSTTAGFGLRVELADALNEGAVEEEDYPGLVTKSYSKNIKNNIKVMRAKGRRLRYGLSVLVVGILMLSTGGVLLFVTLGFWVQVGLLVFIVLMTLVVSHYILTMQYSVLETEDEEDGNDGNSWV